MNDSGGRLTSGSHWGFFGGAFDPPHAGHLRLATELVDKANLSGVLFAPTGRPAHKSEPVASFTERIAMTELACAVDQRFVASDIEGSITPPTYTVRVIEALRKAHPEVRFSVLIGADNLRILSSWREIENLLNLAPIIAAARPGQGPQQRIHEQWKDRVRLIEIDGLEVSSSDIRQRLAQKSTIAGLTPPAVIDYIDQRKLYL